MAETSRDEARCKGARLALNLATLPAYCVSLKFQSPLCLTFLICKRRLKGVLHRVTAWVE